MAYAEDIREQIDKFNICCNRLFLKSKIKNALRGLAFNLENFEDAFIFKDSKKIKIIQKLYQNIAILKPDKVNCVVLLDDQDYVNSVEQLFKDQIEFKILAKDPTITRMATIQNYLRNLCNEREISKAKFDQMRPRNAKHGRAHGFPNTHKTFTKSQNLDQL